MRKYILICAVLFVLNSCDKDVNSMVIDMSLSCIVIDQDGNDLLNPDTEGAIDTSKIEKYYLRNGEFIKFYYNNLDSPKGYRVSKHELDDDHEYICGFGLSPYEEYEGNKTLTIIKWNENESDTIVIDVYKNGGIVQASNIHINGSKNIDWIAPATFKLVKERKKE